MHLVRSSLLAVTVLACAIPRVPGQAVMIWDGSSSTTWATAANWDLNATPGSADTARFNAATNNPNVNAPAAIGRIDFAAGAALTEISGSSTLTIHGVASSGLTNSAGASFDIDPAIALAGTQTWSTSGSGSALVFTRTVNLDSHTLTVDTAADTTISLSTGSGDVISGTGAIIKNGAGTLAFGANVTNTFSGGLTINAGSVTFTGNATLFGTGTLTLNGGTLSSAGTGNRTISNDIVVAGSAAISGTDGRHYRLNADVSGTGTLSIENSSGAGTSSVGFVANTLDYAGNIVIGPNAELRALNTSGTQTLSGTLSGSGAFRRNASGGTTVLSGSNTFSGGVILDLGTVSLGHDNALGTGTLDFSGGTLTASMSRVLANPLNFSGASFLTGGSGITFEFTTGTISGSSGGLTLDNTADAGLLTATFSGAGFNLARTLALSDAFTRLRLANDSGTQTFAAAISGSGSVVRDVAGGTTILSASNTFSGGLTLSAGTIGAGSTSALGSGTFTFAGGALEASGAARNLANAVALTGDAVISGALNLTLSGGITHSGGNRTLSITNAGLTTFSVNALTLAENDATRSFTVDVTGSSGGLVISSVIQDGTGAGADAFVKTGTGNLTLSGANTHTGGTTLAGGLVTVGNNTAFGTGTLTLAGSNLTSTTDRTFANNLTLTASATLRLGNGIDFLFTSDTVTASGGTLSLDNTADSGAATLGFSGQGFDFSSPIAFADAFGTLRLSNPSGTQTFSGAISGDGRLHRNTSGGTTVLSGASSFTGGVTLELGTIRVDHNSALGTGTLTLDGGTLTANSTRTLANALSLTASSTLAGTAGSSLTFSSSSVSTTAGTLTLDNTSDAGTFIAGFSGAGFTFSRPIALADTFTELHLLNPSGTQTFSGVISGPGSLARNASGGSTVLSAANTFSGGTSLTAGTLAVAHNNALGTGTLTLNGGTLEASGGARTLTNSVSLVASSTLGGADNLILSGAVSHSTGHRTLAVTNTGSTTLSGTVTLAENDQVRTLTLDVAGTSSGLTVTGVIQDGTGLGADGLTKAGTGNLTLSSANTYTGATTISAGTLIARHGSALGAAAGGTTVSSGGTLGLENNITIAAESVSLAGTGAGGHGALRSIQGSNTFAGPLALSAAATISANAGQTLTLSGTLAASGHALTLGTATHTGTVAFTGATPALAAVTLDGGTLSVGASTHLQTGALAAASGTTLLIASGGAVTADYAAGNTVFSGTISAAGGTFTKTGDGALVFAQSFDAGAASTLVLAGGKLVLDGAQVTFGTIEITGNTVLDFGASSSTSLTSAHLVIAPNVTVTINNWTGLADSWLVTSTLNGVAHPSSHQVGGTPLDQITFTNYNGLTTTWVVGTSEGWLNHEIRPTPEPAAYGALLVSASATLVLLRRRRTRAV